MGSAEICRKKCVLMVERLGRRNSSNNPTAGRAACSATFTVVVLLLLCGPALLLGASCLNVGLPSWLTSADATYLAGGVRDADLLEQCTPEGILSGSFRDAAEAEVGNYIPTKAIALVASASMQRFAIAASNAVFEWPCYPSSFGSTDLYVPEQRSIVKWPREGAPSEIDGLTKFAESVEAVATKHRDVPFAAYVVARSEASSANPARPLVGESFVAADAAALMGNLMEGATVITHDPVSLEEYYGLYFRSDHHWRAEGAADAYNQFADVFQKPRVLEDTERVDGPLYSGSYARNSLCLIEDVPTQLSCDFSAIELSDGTESQGGAAHTRYRNASNSNKHYYFYDLFYDPFILAKGTGEGKLLLISDSFGFSLIRPLATGFSELSCSRALQADASTEENLEDMIDEIEPDMVLFVADPGNYATFCDRNPQFFN